MRKHKKPHSRDLELENRELRALIESLAGRGLLPPAGQNELAAAYNAGYRAGNQDTIRTYGAGMREDFTKVVLPNISALMNLSTALAGAATVAGFIGIPRADVRDALRPFARRIALDLYRCYHDAEAQLAPTGDPLPEEVAQGVIQFHEALIHFAIGQDDGQALAKCEAIKDTLAGEIWATLGALRMGGSPISEVRLWIGQRVAALREREPGLSYAGAAGQLYRMLIERERAHVLLEVEEAALAELDARANGVFRDYGNLPPAVVSYCKRAAENRAAKGRETRT